MSRRRFLPFVTALSASLLLDCSAPELNHSMLEVSVYEAVIKFFTERYDIDEPEKISINERLWRFQNGGAKRASYLYPTAESLQSVLPECSAAAASDLLSLIEGSPRDHQEQLLSRLKESTITIWPYKKSPYLVTVSEVVFEQSGSAGILYATLSTGDWEVGIFAYVVRTDTYWIVSRYIVDFIT